MFSYWTMLFFPYNKIIFFLGLSIAYHFTDVCLQLPSFSQLFYILGFGTCVLILGRIRLYVITFKIRPEIDLNSLVYITSIVQVNYIDHKNDNIKSDDDQVANKKDTLLIES